MASVTRGFINPTHDPRGGRVSLETHSSGLELATSKGGTKHKLLSRFRDMFKGSKTQEQARYGGAILLHAESTIGKRAGDSLLSNVHGHASKTVKSKASRFSLKVFPSGTRKHRRDEKAKRIRQEKYDDWSDSTLIGSGSEHSPCAPFSACSELASDAEHERPRRASDLGSLHELPGRRSNTPCEMQASMSLNNSNDYVQTSSNVVASSPVPQSRPHLTLQRVLPIPAIMLPQQRRGITLQETIIKSRTQRSCEQPWEIPVGVEHKEPSFTTLASPQAVARTRTFKWARSSTTRQYNRTKESLVLRNCSSATTSTSTTAFDESLDGAQPGKPPLQGASLSRSKARPTRTLARVNNTSLHYHCLICPWPACEQRIQSLTSSVQEHLDDHIGNARASLEADDYACPWPDCGEPFTRDDDHVRAYHIQPLACRATQNTRRMSMDLESGLDEKSASYVRLYQRARTLDDQIDGTQIRLWERRQRCHVAVRCSHPKVDAVMDANDTARICKWEHDLAHVHVAMKRLRALSDVDISGRRQRDCDVVSNTAVQMGTLTSQSVTSSSPKPALSSPTSSYKLMKQHRDQISSEPINPATKFKNSRPETSDFEMSGALRPTMEVKIGNAISQDEQDSPQRGEAMPVSGSECKPPGSNTILTSLLKDLEQMSSSFDSHALEARLRDLHICEASKETLLASPSTAQTCCSGQSKVDFNKSAAQGQATCTSGAGGGSPNNDRKVTTARNTAKIPPSQKRRISPEFERGHPRDSGSDDDDEGRDARPQKRSRVSRAHGVARRLACPFHQREPHLHQRGACTGPGFVDVSKLKSTHLARRHIRVNACPRCWFEFSTSAELDAHLRADIRCVSTNEPNDHRINAQLWKDLNTSREIAVAKTEEEKWKLLYMMIFPDELVPSPYYSYAVAGEAQSYNELLLRELPMLIRRELLNGPNELSLEQMGVVTLAIAGGLQHAFGIYNAGHEAAEASDGSIIPNSSAGSSFKIYELDSGSSSTTAMHTSVDLTKPNHTGVSPISNHQSPVSPIAIETDRHASPDHLHMPVPQSAVQIKLNDNNISPAQFFPHQRNRSNTLYPPPLLPSDDTLRQNSGTPASRPRSRATINLPPIKPPMFPIIAFPATVQQDTHGNAGQSAELGLLDDAEPPPLIDLDSETTHSSESARYHDLPWSLAQWNSKAGSDGNVDALPPPDSGIGLSASDQRVHNVPGEQQMWPNYFNYGIGTSNDIDIALGSSWLDDIPPCPPWDGGAL